VVDKIIRRLEKDKPTTSLRKKKYDTDLYEYPLKRILLCPECWKPMTKRKSLSHTWDYHPYYWCNNATKYNWWKCPLFKKWVPRDLVHYEIKERLKSLSPGEIASDMLRERLKYHWDERMKNRKFEENSKRKKINDIEDSMKKIEDSLDNITNIELVKTREEKWALLDAEKKCIQEELDNPSLADIQYQKLLDKALTVITNPIAIWNLNKPDLVQMLIQVCFNGKIYYKKKEWLHTPELSVIYTTFNAIWNVNSRNLEMMGFEPMSKRHT